MQCRPSSHSEATHCTHLHHLAGGRSKGFSFWLRHLQSSPYTVRKNQGVRYHPTSILDPPVFFFTIFGRKRSHGGPHLYMCDIVWQCGGFFSFFKQQHTKIIDDPSFLGWFQISPRAASTTRDSRAVDRCPPLGGVPKKKRSGSESWKGKEQGRDKSCFCVMTCAHPRNHILKILVQLI